VLKTDVALIYKKLPPVTIGSKLGIQKMMIGCNQIKRFRENMEYMMRAPHPPPPPPGTQV
jgi:hypothetical protein